ncbi:MAG: hypothetical protein R3263_00835 [Myxococcota bacterium]|nr:hypothetical protein [Myxococcota bacterium]
MARRRRWIAGAALLVLAAPAGVRAEWDAGDVAAAEAYREVERERARRYRAQVEAGARPSPRSGLPVPTARADRAAPRDPAPGRRAVRADRSVTRWLGSEWDRAVGLWRAGRERARAWQTSWEVHGAPRLARWRAVFDPPPGPDRDGGSFGERLVRAIRQELAASGSPARRGG